MGRTVSLGRDRRKLMDRVDLRIGIWLETWSLLFSPGPNDRPRLGDLEMAGEDPSEWLAGGESVSISWSKGSRDMDLDSLDRAVEGNELAGSRLEGGKR